MTAYDEWLTKGSDGPKERDDDAMEGAIDTVEDRLTRDCRIPEIISKLYDAYPALAYALREVVFPESLRAEIVALTNLASDIRAKVDDEYQSRITTYDDPRD